MASLRKRKANVAKTKTHTEMETPAINATLLVLVTGDELEIVDVWTNVGSTVGFGFAEGEGEGGGVGIKWLLLKITMDTPITAMLANAVGFVATICCPRDETKETELLGANTCISEL